MVTGTGGPRPVPSPLLICWLDSDSWQLLLASDPQQTGESNASLAGLP